MENRSQNQQTTATPESEHAAGTTGRQSRSWGAIPCHRQPTRRTRPHLDRSLRLVQPALVDLFRALVQGRAPWPLYLFGAAGVGKSRAALALCDHIPGAYYTDLEKLVTEVLDRRDGPTWRYLPEYSLVALDEIATRKTPGDAEYTTLKKIADAREDRPAIYVTNVAPDEVAAVYDDRIARILSGSVYHLVDVDRRRERNQ